MAWTPRDMPDQRGRVAVVTGANGGIGLEVSRELARKGAVVVMAARNQQKAKEAQQSIQADVRGAELDLRELDLGSLESVRACAEGILADHPRIDLLVNNAGIMAVPEQLTADGFESQLGVNHLGHFTLTRRLLPALLAAPAARVVSVTSFARLIGRRVSQDNQHLRGRYGPWRAYGQSKLTNLDFTVELARRLRRAGVAVRSLAAHPGLTYSDLQSRSVRETGGLLQRFWHLAARTAGMSTAGGAAPILRAATDPAARNGELYAPRWFSFGTPVRRPVLRDRLAPSAGRTLWVVSERETGEGFDIG